MFSEFIETLEIPKLVSKSLLGTKKEIETILSKDRFYPKDIPLLLSPAAKPYLEDIAQKAHRITIQRFGKVMQLFVPMYLSNKCFNRCTYCGFSMDLNYNRKTLTPEEIEKEAQILSNKGFQHILLLTGEAPDTVGVDYISKAIQQVKKHFSSVGIEIQPLIQNDYETMIQAGADSLTLYQETYHKESYKKHHLSGKKSNYNYRLNAVEWGAKAKFHRINIGALLGLHEWRYDSIAVAYHLDYLQKKYWQTKYAVSFPRIKEVLGGFLPQYTISDAEYVQLITAFRLCFPDIGITLSTREPQSFRDKLIPLGITQISAESKTSPGGYSEIKAEEQFSISDERPLTTICKTLSDNGYEPVMKDWF